MTPGGRSPLVTFSVPTYNSPYLDQTLQSILTQSLADIEVIVIDDGHRPETRAIVERFADPRARYFSAEGAPGVPANWNRCLRRASGTYFVLLPDDDVVVPEFASQMVAALEAHPAAGFAQCRGMSVDADLNVLEEFVAHAPAPFLTGFDALRWQLDTLRCNPGTLMFRRETLMRFGGWDERYWDDWALAVRIAFRNGFAWVPSVLTKIRSHDTNLSKLIMQSDRDNVLDDINQYAAVFGEALPVTAALLTLRARSARHLSHRAMIKAVRSVLRGQFRAASLHVRRARDLYPLAPFHPGFVAVACRRRFKKS